MLKSVQRLIPFKSASGFTLFALCFSGISYFGVSWYHNRKYDHPIVSEAIRLLQHNDQIIKLAGYPLSLKIKLSSDARASDEVCHFTFQVIGPKGTANVELLGQSRQLKEIEDKSQYYIPSLEQILEILKYQNNEQQLQEEINPDSRFWKIDQLVAEVGLQGDFRISVIDGNKILNPNPQLTLTQITNRKTLKDLKIEIDSRKPKVPQTEQELDEARRYRQQEVYRKIGGVRAVTFIGAILGGMAIYNYVKQHRRISVLNTQIHQQSLVLIQQNAQIRRLFGQHVKFNNQLRGGQIGQVAEFETDIYGSKIGIAYIKGIKDDKTNDWKIESIQVETKNKDGEIDEKIKIW